MRLTNAPPTTTSSCREAGFDPTAIVVYGGGGHGKTLIELLVALGTYRVVGVVDDCLKAGGAVLGVPVVGGRSVLASLVADGVRLAVNAVGGISQVASRVEITRTLTEAGFAMPAVVHPSAWIEASASIGPGAQVLAHAYVGSDAVVGRGALLNTGSIVSHDCRLDDHCILSPGALLAGDVHVGTMTLVGMGATVNLGLRVGRQVRLGNGAVVKTDVPDGEKVRAGSIWPIDDRHSSSVIR
jgi:acetyltransferase EpsM